MRKNKSVLYLCESIIAVMMITLFFCLYISKFLRNPGEVYRGPHHPLLMVLGLTSICIVLALIQHELLSRLGSRLTGAAEQRIPISLSCFKVSVL